jgi:hypothetical protein
MIAMIARGARVASREATQAVFENYNAKPPRKRLPAFEATHSISDTTHHTVYGNVKKKGNTDGVLIRQGKQQHIRHIRSLAFEQQVAPGARLNLSNGGEGKGPRDSITTHNMLIKDDNIDTHADPEPRTDCTYLARLGQRTAVERQALPTASYSLYGIKRSRVRGSDIRQQERLA